MRTMSVENNCFLYDSNLDGTLPKPLPFESICEQFGAQSPSKVCSLKALFNTWSYKKNQEHLYILLIVLKQILELQDYNKMLFCVFIDKDGTPKVFDMLNQNTSTKTLVQDILVKIIDTSLIADMSLSDASRVEAQVALLKKFQKFQKQPKLSLQDVFQGQESENENNQTPIQDRADANPSSLTSETNLDDAAQQEMLEGNSENQNINQTQQSLEDQCKGHGIGNENEHQNLIRPNNQTQDFMEENFQLNELKWGKQEQYVFQQPI